jgi:transposase
MKTITLGIDLAKNVFAVHGVDEFGKVALVRPSVRRDQLLELVATIPPCVIGMGACSGAHHWARAFVGVGHTPKHVLQMAGGVPSPLDLLDLRAPPPRDPAMLAALNAMPV